MNKNELILNGAINRASNLLNDLRAFIQKLPRNEDYSLARRLEYWDKSLESSIESAHNSRSMLHRLKNIIKVQVSLTAINDYLIFVEKHLGERNDQLYLEIEIIKSSLKSEYPYLTKFTQISSNIFAD